MSVDKKKIHVINCEASYHFKVLSYESDGQSVEIELTSSLKTHNYLPITHWRKILTENMMKFSRNFDKTPLLSEVKDIMEKH